MAKFHRLRHRRRTSLVPLHRRSATLSSLSRLDQLVYPKWKVLYSLDLRLVILEYINIGIGAGLCSRSRSGKRKTEKTRTLILTGKKKRERGIRFLIGSKKSSITLILEGQRKSWGRLYLPRPVPITAVVLDTVRQSWPSSALGRGARTCSGRRRPDRSTATSSA
jgi:hypothetical protein